MMNRAMMNPLNRWPFGRASRRAIAGLALLTAVMSGSAHGAEHFPLGRAYLALRKKEAQRVGRNQADRAKSD